MQVCTVRSEPTSGISPRVVNEGYEDGKPFGYQQSLRFFIWYARVGSTQSDFETSAYREASRLSIDLLGLSWATCGTPDKQRCETAADL